PRRSGRMNLLEAKIWTGKIFAGGWRNGAGGEQEVIEPATGDSRGRVGVAAPADVRRAAERAGEAQSAWAAAGYDVRAAVLPVGEALVADPGVALISFTGSTRAGRVVGRLGAEHLKRVHLELGGKSALIVLDDVDVDRAVSVGAFGSFLHQGQICMATSRHLV